MQVFQDTGSCHSELGLQVSYERSSSQRTYHTCFVVSLVPFGITGNVLRLLLLLLLLLPREHLLEELELGLRQAHEGAEK